MSLGVKRGQVVLSEYQETWVDEYNHVKNEILNVVKLDKNAIHHIGSTSIPGLSAKPIIDILIGVEDYMSLPEYFFKELKTIGIYRLRVEKDDEIVLAKFEDESFQKHTHFIHIVNKEQQKYTELLKFRDYLLSHSDARMEYQRLKEKLYTQYADDRPRYTQEKEAFIKLIINNE
ncbi:GrpB family protein [Macrococcoides goetzii]|uniref:GrpB family protein n=1 Tax=Macrococcoides goetzii TaxID=1891097 RepID=A0A2G5NSJ6_9STAP|nr:GrpB family protein [Macrococcus goetzii]RAI82653.1 GrpB family protein [Macrococcus goetzii]